MDILLDYVETFDIVASGKDLDRTISKLVYNLSMEVRNFEVALQ